MASRASRSTATTCSRSMPRPREAADRARRGDGPSLIVADTYRFYGHNVGEAGRLPEQGTRSRSAGSRDPIPRYEAWLQENGLLDADALQAGLGRGTAEDLEDSVTLRRSRAPDPDPATASIDLLRRQPRRLEHALMPYLSIGQATNDAMRVVMRLDPSVIVLGARHPLGRIVRTVPRALRRVRRARHRHADLRVDHRRGERRRGDPRHAAGGLDELRRVLDGRDGRAGEPGGQAPLHVRRPGQGAVRAPLRRRNHPLGRRPALGKPRGAVRPRSRPQGRGAVQRL